MEGRRTNGKEQKDGSIPHQPRLFRFLSVVCSFGTLEVFIDLAIEWGDFSMWEDALKANKSERDLARLGLDVVIRAWDVFTFDRVKDMFVHSILPLMPYFLCSSFTPFNPTCRIEKVIHEHNGTRTRIDRIRTLQAHASGQDASVKTWLKQQATAVLSSIKSPPSDSDVQMFVDTAKSDGLLFFSQTCVPASGKNDSLV
jgi:hypothetical protein